MELLRKKMHVYTQKMLYTILENSQAIVPSNKLWNHRLKNLSLMKLAETAGVLSMHKSQSEEQKQYSWKAANIHEFTY